MNKIKLMNEQSLKTKSVSGEDIKGFNTSYGLNPTGVAYNTNFMTPAEWAAYGARGGQVGGVGGNSLYIDPTKAYTGNIYDVSDAASIANVDNAIAGGTVDPASGQTTGLGSLVDTAPDADSWTSMQGKGGLTLDVANTGLGLMNFLDQKKTAKIQRDLMKQQLASNQETMAQKRADRANINAAFNSGGQGLKI